jgi:hypothetical protein
MLIALYLSFNRKHANAAPGVYTIYLADPQEAMQKQSGAVVIARKREGKADDSQR